LALVAEAAAPYCSEEIIMLTVTSADGTTIAADRTGTGPAVVLVAGALTARDAHAPLAALMAPHFTVYAYDRRGRGDSGDTPPYAVDRELDDLAAIVDAAGGHAHVFGHSSGAVIALEAAERGVRIDRLALYEPPLKVDGDPMPDEFVDQLNTLIRAGRRGDALALWMRMTVRMPDEAIAQARTEPWWAAVEAIVHTTPYDATITAPYRTGQPLPAGRWAKVDVPALVMDGEISTASMRSGAAALIERLPDATGYTFPGQGHGAPPDMVAPVLESFFLG
jgi:pimeloyl-ACP methyl ester carboxylesterase